MRYFIFLVRLKTKGAITFTFFAISCPLLLPHAIINYYLYARVYFDATELRDTYFFATSEIIHYVSNDIGAFTGENTFSCQPRLYTHMNIPLIKGEVINGLVCTENGIALVLDNVDIKSYHYAGTHNGWMIYKSKAKRNLFLINQTLSGRTFFISLNMLSQVTRDELYRQCAHCFFIEQKNTSKVLDLSLSYGNPQVKDAANVQRISFDTDYGSESFWYNMELKKKAFSEVQFYLFIITVMFLVATFIFINIYRMKKPLLYEMLMGIKKGEFKNHYQPIIDSRTNRIVGVEALVRWYKQDAMVSPATFIPYLEDNHCLFILTQKVIESAIKDITTAPHGIWISVNIGVHDLISGQLYAYLKRLRFPLKGRLVFEITERQYSNKLSTINEQISLLVKHGYEFKVDDFGTGAAGLTYISKLDINSVKIDKSYIDLIAGGDESALLNSIINIVHAYALDIIAEGVENEQQVEYLMSKGVYLHQGYFYAKPMPMKQLFKLDVFTPLSHKILT